MSAILTTDRTVPILLARVSRAAALDELDADAQPAYRAFCLSLEVLCATASDEIVALGRAAAGSYFQALRTTVPGLRPPAWAAFVRVLWDLCCALDRYPSRASRRWREARGALGRIVVENLDLIEAWPRPALRCLDRPLLLPPAPPADRPGEFDRREVPAGCS
jgi:hypothetical protein